MVMGVASGATRGSLLLMVEMGKLVLIGGCYNCTRGSSLAKVACSTALSNIISKQGEHVQSCSTS
jgi:hypothetical protein